MKGNLNEWDIWGNHKCVGIYSETVDMWWNNLEP